MSSFSFECLNCGELKSFFGCPSQLIEFRCEKCNSLHKKIADIYGLHVCHSLPIWRLEGTDKISVSNILATAMRVEGIKIVWRIKDKDKTKEYIDRIGKLIGRKK